MADDETPTDHNGGEHHWETCAMCGPMVVCGKCGNNCCNGGYGLIDGKECGACPSAYDKQDAEREQHRSDTAPCAGFEGVGL